MYNLSITLPQIAEGLMGHLAVYYTSPQSFVLVFLFVALTSLGTFYLILIGGFIK